MRILIDIGHPGHVHLFKHFIWEMQERGHTFLVTARKKEVSHDLLSGYGIPFVGVGVEGRGKAAVIREWARREVTIFNLARAFRPDILMGMGNPCVAHVGALLRKPSIIFTDTEHATTQNSLSFPFCSTILTPSCYGDDAGPKQIRYNGYHELAYLHPNRFTPDPSVLEEIGLSTEETFTVVRLVSWQASHDAGQRGIRDPVGLVEALSRYGRVLITSELSLPPELECYRIRVSPEKLHHLLYYASLYIGEGATTASECAVLGTHAIFVNTLRLGYTDEEEARYGLMFTFSDPNGTDGDVIHKAVELLTDPELRKNGKIKRERLLNEKIDVTAFMLLFVENYPQSSLELKEHCASRTGVAHGREQ